MVAVGAEEFMGTAGALDGPSASEQGPPPPQMTTSLFVSVKLEFESLPTTTPRFGTAEASARRERVPRTKMSRFLIVESSFESKMY